MYASFNARALGLDLSAEETVALGSAAGFRGVDLLVRDFLDGGGDPRALRSRMDDLGVRGGAWPLPVDWRGDAGRFARDLERLPRYAEAAAVLGLSRTGTWVLPETPGLPESDNERDTYLASVAAWHVERLGAIARILARHGSRLGLEVIGVESFRTGRGLPFVARLGDLDGWLGALWDQAPNLGILLDAYHLYAAGEPVEAALAWGIGRIVWVHVADLPASASVADRRAMRDDDRGLPGEHGAIDCRRLLRRLEDAGYDGPITAEPLAGCRSLAGRTAEATARDVAEALRSAWPNESFS